MRQLQIFRPESGPRPEHRPSTARPDSAPQSSLTGSVPCPDHRLSTAVESPAPVATEAHRNPSFELRFEVRVRGCGSIPPLRFSFGCTPHGDLTDGQSL